MLARLPTPRLLPTTIAFTTVLLVVKCGMLVDAALFDGTRTDAAMVGEAKAAGTEPTTKPVNHPPVAGGVPPSLPAPAKPSANAEAPAAKPDGMTDTGKTDTAAPAVSQGEKALLQDLRQRRQALDERADALKAREAVLGAAEQKLGARVAELQALQKKLEVLNSAQKQKEEAAWDAMAKLYEAMKPKDAATIFNDLAMPVLLQVLNRMKDPKAAAVMAAMNPDKARDVTAELARLRLGHDPATAPDGVRSPKAGG